MRFYFPRNLFCKFLTYLQKQQFFLVIYSIVIKYTSFIQVSGIQEIIHLIHFYYFFYQFLFHLTKPLATCKALNY